MPSVRRLCWQWNQRLALSSPCPPVRFWERLSAPGNEAREYQDGKQKKVPSDPASQRFPPTGMRGPRMDSGDAERLPLCSPLRLLAASDQRSGGRQLAISS
jgi:hypothetical protein